MDDPCCAAYPESGLIVGRVRWQGQPATVWCRACGAVSVGGQAWQRPVGAAPDVPLDRGGLDKDEILGRIAEDGLWSSIDWNETRYVACDEPCFALREPQTAEELRAALEHWRDHSFTHGCSHGR